MNIAITMDGKQAEFAEALCSMARQATGAEMAEAMERFVNNLSEDTFHGFVERMGRSHRTLQQGFSRLCILWFAQLAEAGKARQFDLRNEASVKLAAKIMELNTALPLI